MPNHEIGRVALTVVAKLFSKLETGDVRRWQQRDFIARRLEDRSNQPFMLPGQTAEQDRHLVAFGGRKRTLNWSREMCRWCWQCAVTGLLLQPLPLFSDALLDLLLELAA